MDKRINQRIPVELPVTVRFGGRDVPCLTQNVNRRGLFVRTDRPKPLRFLAQLWLKLPPEGEELKLMAVVVHSVTPEQAAERGRVPGMGLRLYNLGPKEQKVWESFLVQALEAWQATQPEPPWVRPSGTIDSVRRRHTRFAVTFEVQVRDLGSLYQMLTKDISVGGMFLQAEPLLKVNNPVQMVVIHPLNGMEFPLEGRVVRVVEQPPEQRGIGVQFVGMTEETLQRFQHFIESGISQLVSDEVLIELDDPLLAS